MAGVPLPQVATLAIVKGRGMGAALLACLFALLAGCSEPVPGTAIGVPASSTSARPDSGGGPVLASSGPRLTSPKKPGQVSPCAIATEQQVSAALGAVKGSPAPLNGIADSCVWPLDSGSKNGFLVGYGLGYEDVVRTHAAAQGAFGRTTDGNSTWLWCEVSDETGAFTCGAAVAITADRTFLTGLVRSPSSGRTKTSTLAELQTITIPLFRSLPGL